MDIQEKLARIIAADMKIPVDVPCDRSPSVASDELLIGTGDPQTERRIGKDILLEAFDEIDLLRGRVNRGDGDASAETEAERLRKLVEAQESELAALRAKLHELAPELPATPEPPAPATT